MLRGALPLHAKVIKPAEEAEKTVQTDRLRARIAFLSDTLCQGRATGSTGSSEAAMWIVRMFRQQGLRPLGGSYVRHFITPTGVTGRNIIGMLPSNSTIPSASYVIVMAHYDGLGVLGDRLYPGADSNASGVAAMIQMAEMFSVMRKFRQIYRKNILFVALDAKGLNMHGAQDLWNSIESGFLVNPSTGEPIRPDMISSVVNIEQIGSTLSPIRDTRPDYLIMLGRESMPSFTRDDLAACNLRYGTGLDLGFDYYGSKDFTRLFYRKVSEQRFFVEHGIPAVMFTSGITLNNNKTYDTVDTLDLDILRKRIILIFHYLERLA